MSYFISPPESPNWRIESETLAEQILLRWPEAQIEKITQPESLHALSWTLRIGEWRLDGTLTKDGTVVHLEGDVRACAVFATWFRGIVPSEQDLIFYDDGYSADVPLTPSTTEDELCAPFLSS
jgi:hypothetical protein